MSQIENAIHEAYSKKSGYSELKALEMLTDKKILDALKLELEKNLRDEDSYRQKIYVDFEWIDKIPVAKFCHTQKDMNNNIINEKVEIGDLFIRYNRQRVNPVDGKIQIIHMNSFELVVQAKVTKQETFYVPITNMSKSKISSTSKELKLLEDWPKFDLYKTATNSKCLADNLSIDKKNNPFAFYGGFSNKSKTWKFGEAKYANECVLSFTQLIEGLVTGKLGKNKFLKSDISWNKMSDCIESLCTSQFAPPKLFGESSSRRRTANATLYCCSGLFELICKLFEFLKSFFTNTKLLVISINQVDYEGETAKYV